MLKYFFLSKKNQEFLTLLKKHKGLHKNYYRFYRNQKGKLSKSLVNYLFPERHFVVKGQYFARKPFATYDPFDYFNYMFLSQDLAESSYQSYLRHKHINAADINTKAGKLYNKLKEIDEKYQNIDFKIKENKQDIAIVLHLYHLELLDELLAYINKIEMDFDLYITIGDHASPLQREEINSKIKNKQADAFIAYVPNHGRDIFPLLQLINNNLLNDYKAILKLHSKKKLHDLEKGEKRNETI